MLTCSEHGLSCLMNWCGSVVFISNMPSWAVLPSNVHPGTDREYMMSQTRRQRSTLQVTYSQTVEIFTRQTSMFQVMISLRQFKMVCGFKTRTTSSYFLLVFRVLEYPPWRFHFHKIGIRLGKEVSMLSGNREQRAWATPCTVTLQFMESNFFWIFVHAILAWKWRLLPFAGLLRPVSGLSSWMTSPFLWDSSSIISFFPVNPPTAARLPSVGDEKCSMRIIWGFKLCLSSLGENNGKHFLLFFPSEKLRHSNKFLRHENRNWKGVSVPETGLLINDLLASFGRFIWQHQVCLWLHRKLLNFRRGLKAIIYFPTVVYKLCRKHFQHSFETAAAWQEKLIEWMTW